MANSKNIHALDDIMLSLSPTQEQTMFQFDEEFFDGFLPAADLNLESITMLEEGMVNSYGFEKCIQDHEKKMEDRFKDIQKKMKDIQKQIEDRFQEEKREREISAKALIEMLTKALGSVTRKHETVCGGISE